MSVPLSCKESFRSHWAIGITNDIPIISAICANEQGKTMHSSSKLNFPNPVALMASSKLTGSETRKRLWGSLSLSF